MMYLIFCLSFFLIAYNLILYPFLLFIFSLFFKEKKVKQLEHYPTITVLCPAYNEEKTIKEKIESFINLNYPKDKIKMIIISDDSTDKTNEIVKYYEERYTNLKLIIQKPRKGKVSGLNMVEPSINTNYVLSTDATSIFDKDAVINLLKVMEANPKIGFVGGDMKFLQEGQTSGEETYFSIENKIKYWESKIYSTITANGVLFLIKRELFTQMPPTAPDDFERCLYTIKKGFLAKFTYDAFVYEKVESKASEEFKRKVRIIATSWATLFRQKALLNPFKHHIVTLFLISHKLLRWFIGYFSLLILISSFFLIQIPFFRYFFIFETFFIVFGLFEIFLQSKDRSCKITKFFGYFVAMNLASIVGFYKFITKKYSGVWETNR